MSTTAKNYAEMMKKKVSKETVVSTPQPVLQQPQIVHPNLYTGQVVYQAPQPFMQPPPQLSIQQQQLGVQQVQRHQPQQISPEISARFQQNKDVMPKASTEQLKNFIGINIPHSQKKETFEQRPEEIIAKNSREPIVTQISQAPAPVNDEQYKALFVKFQSSSQDEKKMLLKEHAGLRQFITKALEDKKKKKEIPVPQSEPIPTQKSGLLEPITPSKKKTPETKGKKGRPAQKEKETNVDDLQDASKIPGLDLEKEQDIDLSDDEHAINVEIKTSDFLSKNHLKNKLERVAQETGTKVKIDDVYEIMSEATNVFLQNMIESLIHISNNRRRKYSMSKETSRREFDLYERMKGVKEETIMFEKKETMDKKKKTEAKDPKLIEEEEKKKQDQTTNILDMALGVTKKRKVLDNPVMPDKKKVITNQITNTSKYTIIHDDIVKQLETPIQTRKSKILYSVLLKKK